MKRQGPPRQAARKRRLQVTHLAVLPDSERFYTKREVAELLRISVRHVTELMQRNRLPYFRVGRRLVRFRLPDLVCRLSEPAGPGQGGKKASRS